MEWVKVVYPTTRDVFIDGRRSGQTNVTLVVARGTHEFDLGVPVDYTPPSQTVAVKNTTSLSPLPVVFT